MEALRAALWAFLDEPDESGHPEVWRPLIDRLNAALDTVEDPVALESLANEFRAEARRRDRWKFADSPLYPWGVVNYLYTKAARLQLAAADPNTPCNPGLAPHLLRSDEFIKIGESDDFYDRWEEFRCPFCGAIWRWVDKSTEQYSAWVWEFIRGGDGS